MLVVGVDAANWKVIKPNLGELPNWRRLMEGGDHGTIYLNIEPLSAVSWTSMFSGKQPEEHENENFVADGKLKSREDIPVDFVWDLLAERGYKVKALNIPIVYPPFSFNCDFEAAMHGLGLSESELGKQNRKVAKKALKVAKGGNYDLFIVAFTVLDKLQHFHWGEEELLVRWYRKIGQTLGELADYEKRRKGKILVTSDHGFCNREEAEVQTLPGETSRGRKIKGDHSSEAIFIQQGLERNPQSIPDMADVILREVTS